MSGLLVSEGDGQLFHPFLLDHGKAGLNGGVLDAQGEGGKAGKVGKNSRQF